MGTDRDRRTTVAVRPGAALAARPRLFAALEVAFPVRFDPSGPADRDAGAAIEFRDGNGSPRRAGDPDPGIPTLSVADRVGQAPLAEVVLGQRESVDRRLRGISFLDRLDDAVAAPGEADQILATVGSTPVWTRSPGSTPVDRVSSSLPELDQDQGLRDLLAERPLPMVALVQLLRAVTAPLAFRLPKPRAAILFDDPNLRWRTYGFIDFRRLLAHAQEHGYHAAMAMIPLDGRHQHRATVDLFRAHPDRLSLVCHGNNHLARELMEPGGDAGALALAAQALRRMDRFESRYGLRIDRVMTPPHGMCSESAARALGALGYDGLCAIHPLPWTEQPPADRPLAGWDPAEFAAGCAVIPRIHLRTPFNEIALRAFMDQPLILYGHHDDLAGGLEILADTASRINGLGDIQWSSLAEIAAANYSTRLSGDTLRIRPYAHRLRLDVPSVAGSILVEKPREESGGLFSGWSTPTSVAPFDAPLAGAAGSLELRLRPASQIDPASVPAPPTRAWPLFRRAATETRDRLRPLLPASSA